MNRLVVLGCVACGVVAAVGACDDEPSGPEAGESFVLEVGERATLEAIQASVRFVAVSEDSRCPSQAQCVWAGDGAVVLEIAPADADAAEDTLHTNEESGPRSSVLGRYELTLLQLDPYPEIPGAISPDAYRATLVLYERLEGPSE